jgi:hypothetical protein
MSKSREKWLTEETARFHRGMMGRYAVALTLVPLIAITTFFGISWIIKTREDHQVKIDLTTQQCILSQQIAQLSERLIHETPEARTDLRKQLRLIVFLMESERQELRVKNLSASRLDPTLHDSVDESISAYISHARA